MKHVPEGAPAFIITGYGSITKWTPERGFEVIEPCNARRDGTGNACSLPRDHEGGHSWETGR